MQFWCGCFNIGSFVGPVSSAKLQPKITEHSILYLDDQKEAILDSKAKQGQQEYQIADLTRPILTLK